MVVGYRDNGSTMEDVQGCKIIAGPRPYIFIRNHGQRDADVARIASSSYFNRATQPARFDINFRFQRWWKGRKHTFHHLVVDCPARRGFQQAQRTVKTIDDWRAVALSPFAVRRSRVKARVVPRQANPLHSIVNRKVHRRRHRTAGGASHSIRTNHASQSVNPVSNQSFKRAHTRPTHWAVLAPLTVK